MISDQLEPSNGIELPPHLREKRDRARKDFRYFCAEFLKIKPKRDDWAELEEQQSTLVPFIWNEAQEEVWALMQEFIRSRRPIKIVILKARQFGISTFFCAWIFWNMWRMNNVKAGIAVQNKDLTLQEMLETMNTFYQSFPEGFRPRLRAAKAGARVNKFEMYMAERNSQMRGTPAVKDAFRGLALDIALCTEVSSYKDPGEFFGGFTPAMNVGPNMTLILESSPKDGYFQSRYESAKRKEGGFAALFLAWWMVPKLYSREIVRGGGRTRAMYDKETGERIYFTREERLKQKLLSRRAVAIGRPPITDEQMWWRQFKINGDHDGDEEFFNQEYPEDDESCFLRSTSSAFKSCLPIVQESVDEVFDVYPDAAMGVLESATYADVDAAVQTVHFIEEPKEGWIDQERRAGLLMIAPPKHGYTYTIGADVADENGAMGDEDDESAYSVGSVYCCDTREQVAEWRGHIDPHDFGDELVKLGYFYNTAIINVEYNNMGVTTVDRLTRYLMYPIRFRWPKADEAGKLTKKEMWWTDSRTKQLLIGSFKHAVDKGLFIVRSPGLRKEMADYVVKNGVYKTNSYADRIIAAALAWQCVEQTDFAYRSIVLGSAERPPEPGTFARTVVKAKGGPPPVPRELPPGFGGMTGVEMISDVWDMAKI